MKLNANLQERVVVLTENLPWRDSPMPGVQRRMLERDGEEVARATSIVRYAPGRYFSAHTHGGGEEFLVLDGIFSDQHGDYEPGTYVRNPVGSSHTPYSQEGCTIFVKLWQMHPQDQQRVVIPTAQAEFREASPGVQVMPLHTYKTEQVTLMKLTAGTTLSSNQHGGGQEIFVLEGALNQEQAVYPKGAWLRNPSENMQVLSSAEDCLIYLKTGHLAL